MDIKRLIRSNVRRLEAYRAEEIPCSFKLDANESPFNFPWLLNALGDIPTNRYPDPEGKALRKAASRRWRVKACNILLGNGSDELIYYLVTTFGGPVLFPTPTFSMYGIVAQALGGETVGVPLDENFDLQMDAMLSAISRHRPKLIFLSSPNNPTGNSFSSDKIVKIIKAAKAIVVIDEAYQPFEGGKGMLSMLDDFENVAVMRTLSKVGFASLRVGFLISGAEVISTVNKVRLPFNVNALSQMVAVEVFRNYREVDKTVKTIVRERKRVFNELKRLRGITAFPSDANFILFRTSRSSLIQDELLTRGVLIKDMGNILKDCLRVTVGSQEENKVFLETLKSIVS
jgi:histidinol-phosphate aminotransferase